MPVKRLSEKQEDKILDITKEWLDDDIDAYEMIDELNHIFAKIYGYKRTGRAKSRDSKGRTWVKINNPRTKKRTLSAWNKFVKSNSKKKKFQFRDGKLKLKQMGIAYRKTRAYKQSRRKK